MAGEACKSIKDDLKKLGNDFPEWKEKTNEIIKEVYAGVGKNGKMKTRGNKHAGSITKVIKEILLEKIIGMEGDKNKIEIKDILYRPQVDIHLIYEKRNEKKIHIFLEYKRWMKDSNQIRSAILNSLLIKEYGKTNENHFYLIGGGVKSIDEVLKKQGDVLKPLLSWAKEKEYLKAYSIRELNKLIDDIKRACQDK